MSLSKHLAVRLGVKNKRTVALGYETKRGSVGDGGKGYEGARVVKLIAEGTGF